MMGVYLLSIASQDVKFRNEYNRHALVWLHSPGCKATGVIAMVSSEVSILILTYLSIERYVMIVHPYTMKRISVKMACASMLVIWSLGFTLGILPLASEDAFGKFYGSSGVCFPLHIHDPFLPGWQYSAVVLIGLNAVALAIIAFCYVSILISIVKVRKEYM